MQPFYTVCYMCKWNSIVELFLCLNYKPTTKRHTKGYFFCDVTPSWYPVPTSFIMFIFPIIICFMCSLEMDWSAVLFTLVVASSDILSQCKYFIKVPKLKLRTFVLRYKACVVNFLTRFLTLILYIVFFVGSLTKCQTFLLSCVVSSRELLRGFVE